ncbi:MAG: lysophospholipid acyltransferase family protein [Bacilli bacterium]
MKLAYLICVFVPHLIAEYFRWIRRMAKHPERYPIELRFFKVKSLVSNLNKAMDNKIAYINTTDMYKSDKKFIMFCNHQSMFDPLALILNAKRPIAFLAKKESRNFIFVGKVAKIIGSEFLDRENLKSQVKVIMKIQRSLANNEIDWGVFPEGTRQKDPSLDVLDFHSGTFKIPQKAHCDIYLTAIYGTFKILQFLKFPKYGLTAGINVFKKVPYDDIKNVETTELSVKMKDEINEKVKVLREEDQKLLVS